MNKNAKQIILCTSGTIMEWYDFSLYACMAEIISTVFFPHTSHSTAIILTFMIFASGFIMRPIGAICFGHIGDKIGRKSSLLITISIMAISTTFMGVLPIGMGTFSIMLLALLRIIQGFASSGEYPGGITLLYEMASKEHKGFISSFGIFAALFGIFLGTLVSATVGNILTHDQMMAWGWRIPFLIGLPLGTIGFISRKYLYESKEFINAQENNKLTKLPALQVITKYKKNFLCLLGMYVLANISFYMNFVYLPSMAVSKHLISSSQSLFLNAVSTLLYAVFIPVFGYLSDKFDRKIIMISACLLMIVFIHPLFLMVYNGNYYQHLVGQSIISILIGMFVGPLAVVTAELFSTNVRFCGVGMSLNFAAAIFGGTTPLVCAWLVEFTKISSSPIYYFIFSSVIALIALGVLNFKLDRPIMEIYNERI